MFICLCLLTVGGFPIVKDDELGDFLKGLSSVGKRERQAVELAFYSSYKGINGYVFNLDGTVTSEVSGGFMPSKDFTEPWDRMKPTEDFVAMASLLQREGYPWYIVTHSDKASLMKVDLKMLKQKGGYLEHHFKQEEFRRKLSKKLEKGSDLDQFKRQCFVEGALVKEVLKKSTVKFTPKKIFALYPG